MTSSLVIGTVRAVRGGRHIVVSRDGSSIEVVFDGEGRPQIGGDVIGMLRKGEDGRNYMTLKRSVADALLEGNVRISPAGNRPDLTARLLAKFLSRSRSAVLAPGSGLSIERSPISNDEDLNWAISSFRPEADRLLIALNVIDVRAVANAPWRASTLNDLTLPADVEGNGRAMRDLSRLLRSGFHPDCNRMIEDISGMREISVNFVIPYSPFAGGSGFSRSISGMDRNHHPLPQISTSEARRLSSARNVALALAHAKLGAGGQADIDQSRRAVHMANCFADAAAVMAFIKSGGNVQAVEAYADLKESSLYFGVRPGSDVLRESILEEASHRAVRAALEADALERATSPKAILNEAVRIARRTALPAARFNGDVNLVTEMELYSARNAAGRVSVNLREVDNDTADRLSEFYRDEINALAREHASSDLAASRLVMFGAICAPLRFTNIFDEETRHLPRAETLVKKETVGTVLTNRSKLAKRIRSATSANDDALEFAEPVAAPGL